MQEQIKRKFVRSLERSITKGYPKFAPHKNLLDKYKMIALDTRRYSSLIKYLYKKVNSNIYSANILDDININVPNTNEKVMTKPFFYFMLKILHKIKVK